MSDKPAWASCGSLSSTSLTPGSLPQRLLSLNFLVTLQPAKQAPSPDLLHVLLPLSGQSFPNHVLSVQPTSLYSRHEVPLNPALEATGGREEFASLGPPYPDVPSTICMRLLLAPAGGSRISANPPTPNCEGAHILSALTPNLSR